MSSFNFDAFPSIAAEKAGIDIKIKLEDGSESGFVIHAIGPNGDRRRAFREDLFTKRTERGLKKLTLAEVDQSRLDEAVAATISWTFPEGQTGPECTPENAREIYTNHPSILDQVMEETDKPQNFILSKKSS